MSKFSKWQTAERTQKPSPNNFTAAELWTELDQVCYWNQNYTQQILNKSKTKKNYDFDPTDLW